MSSTTPPPTARARRRPAKRRGPQGIRALLLWFEFGEMRAHVAIGIVTLVAVALGLASVWPALARLEAMAAMLCLPGLAVVVALRRSVIHGRWLRLGVFTVGGASAALALAAALSALFPSEPLASVWLGPRAPERSLALAAEQSHVTLTVRAPGRGPDEPLRLDVGRGGREREVRVSLETPPADAPFETSPELLGTSEFLVERRVSTAVPGQGPLRVRLLGPVESWSPRIELAVRSTSLTDRHAAPIGGALAVLGIALQFMAERRRSRSWLLLGSWCAIGFALWVPTVWDPSQPGWTALGTLLFGAIAGGGVAALLSYLIARRYAAPDS